MKQARKNVLLIVVDQWRGDTLPMLGHPIVKTPHIAALAAQGVTFARHYTQAVPCGPGRASLLTGLYMMNHRAVQNTIPLDARHTNLAFELRKGGYDPALVGYTTTTPDPRVVSSEDPRFTVLGADMEGWHPVGSWGMKMEAYFSWVASQGFALPDNPWFRSCKTSFALIFRTITGTPSTRCPSHGGRSFSGGSQPHLSMANPNCP